MRMAVLVYGRLNKSAAHYKNIIETLGNHDIDYFAASDNSSEEVLNDFIRLYKPLSYNNSPIYYDYDLNIYPGKRPESDMNRMSRHLINKNRVFLLLEEYIQKHNIHYDCVMSLRVDCVFNTPFSFDSLEDNTIYIPFDYDYVDNGINDQIAYGKIDVMKKYNSINPVELLEKKLCIPHPESLNYANLHLHGIKIERPKMNYHLER